MAEKRRRTHRWAFPLGFSLVALALVGAVTLVTLLVNGVKQQIENPKDKLRYEEFLRIVVMHDPDPFDDVDTAPNISQLLDIAIWSLQSDTGATPKEYPMDDDGNLLMPQTDVEKEFLRLFGKDVPMHETIEGADYEFVYDAQEKVYRVPATGTLQIYVPEVTDIEKLGNSVRLTVDYLAYHTGDWQFESDGKPVKPAPVKTMLITLFEDDQHLTVGSIQLPAGQQLAAEGSTVLG
ncbi:MAG: hypothetical protein LBQ33_02825 [Oscillospiraceae bacterium]|jgi:hypothetical protein|nr:hypothetical protein [Oscillospiraceae bacterium]